MKTITHTKSLLIFVAAVATFFVNGCSGDGVENVRGLEDHQYAPHPVVSPETATTPSSQDSGTPLTKTPVSHLSDAVRQEYLDLINAARAETQDCGQRGVFDPAPALSWNVRLEHAAYEHSNDMAQSNTFSHIGSGSVTDTTAQDQRLGRGSKFYERIENSGYIRYRKVGENIAAGYTTPEEVVEAWLESDEHCANLMDPVFTEMGMVKVTKSDSNYGTYWSQELGWE